MKLWIIYTETTEHRRRIQDSSLNILKIFGIKVLFSVVDPTVKLNEQINLWDSQISKICVSTSKITLRINNQFYVKRLFWLKIKHTFPIFLNPFDCAMTLNFHSKVKMKVLLNDQKLSFKKFTWFFYNFPKLFLLARMRNMLLFGNVFRICVYFRSYSN